MNLSKIFWIFSVSIIFLLGLIMVYNTTSAEILDKSINGSLYDPLLKQILYGTIGIALGFVIYLYGYRNVLRISPFLFYVGIIFLSLVFIPKIGFGMNGARRWVKILGISFQPSEFMKYIIPLYFIQKYFSEKKIQTFWDFIKFLFIFIVPISLILLEPDNGTTAIILVSFIILFFLLKIKLTFWAFPLFLIVLIGGAVASQMPHVPSRIKIYLNPELDIRGKGHQPYQAKIAAGSGKIFGKGLGQSMQKLNYLPEARSDYIAAIYAEEFGFIGILFLVGLYLILVFSGFFIAANTKDKRASSLAAICTFLICFQAFLNLGIVSGLLPSKGTTLPFFSQGGSSLIVNFIAFFIVLSIANEKKYSNKLYKKKTF